MPQKNVFIVSKDVHLSSCWSVNKHLSVNMLFKYCLVWSVRRRVWKKKKKKSPPGFMLLLCPSTWGHNVSKNTSFLYSRNWKKYKTYVVAQSHPKNQDISLLCFIFFLSLWDSFLPLFIVASKNTIKYAPLQGGSHWLVRAVSQVWPGTETQHTGNSPSGCCRALRCEEFPGWQGSQQKEGW